MNGLLLDRSYEVGGVVAVVHGPLSGIRGVVIRITDDDKVVIRLDESGEVYLVVAAENIAAKPSASSPTLIRGGH